MTRPIQAEYSPAHSVLGYYYGNKWSPAPNPRGDIPLEAPQSPHYAPYPALGPFPSGTRSLAEHSYSAHKDPAGHFYVAIPANGGFVPARHGNDPTVGNWVSTASTIQIVYDSNRYMHPAIEGLDYSQHGFQHTGRIWWPIKNGPLPDPLPSHRIEKSPPHSLPKLPAPLALYRRIQAGDVISLVALIGTLFFNPAKPLLQVISSITGLFSLAEVALDYKSLCDHNSITPLLQRQRAFTQLLNGQDLSTPTTTPIKTSHKIYWAAAAIFSTLGFLTGHLLEALAFNCLTRESMHRSTTPSFDLRSPPYLQDPLYKEITQYTPLFPIGPKLPSTHQAHPQYLAPTH